MRFGSDEPMVFFRRMDSNNSRGHKESAWDGIGEAMDTVDYAMIFALSFGTGLGTTLGAEVARFLIGSFRKRVKKEG